MKIAVAGACSRSGKTALAATFLQALGPGGAAALKFTTTDDVFARCPRGAPCVVCDIDVPFRIVEDPAVLREPGTDTDRLAAAGGAPVLWTIARQGAARSAWQAVALRLGHAAAVVIEGSSVVDLAQPDLLTFVVHPFLSPARWKPTSASLLERADAVIVNRPAGDGRAPAPEVLEAVARYRPRDDLRIVDVTRPLRDWAPDLASRLNASRVP